MSTQTKQDSNFHNEIFLSWLAGFIDGEGTFSIEVFKHSRMKLHYQIRPKIEVGLAQTSLEILKEIQVQTHMGTIIKRHRKFNPVAPRTQDQVTWRVRGWIKTGLLAERLLPYLKVKEKIAKDFLAINDKIGRNEHLNKEGFLEICRMRDSLNSHRPRSPNFVDFNQFKKILN